MSDQGADRACTCHPDDNPPQPCAKQFALSECRISAQAPKLKPLSYDQIIKATEEIRAFAPNVRIQLARAIERAHGIT